MIIYECIDDGTGKGTWTPVSGKSDRTYGDALGIAFPLGDATGNYKKAYGDKIPAKFKVCVDPKEPCVASKIEGAEKGSSAAQQAAALAGWCKPIEGTDNDGDPLGAECTCEPPPTPSGGGPSGDGQSGGGAQQNIEKKPNLGLSIAVIIATLIAIGFILENNPRDKMMFSLGVLAVALILTIGFVAKPLDTKYAVIEPLLRTTQFATLDPIHEVFLNPAEGDEVVTQLNNQQGLPLTVTRHYVFSGSTQVAIAEDLGLAQIAAAGPAAHLSQVLFSGPSSDDPLQILLVTANVDATSVTPIATAPLGVQPTEVYQTIANGNLITYATTAENTYVDIQSPTRPVTSFTPEAIIKQINDIIQATPDTIVGITSDGTLATVDLASQEFTSTDVAATDIVHPPSEPTNTIAANPDYIPNNNILIVNPDQTAQFVDVNLAPQSNYAPTDLGLVASTTATLTPEGTLVSVDLTGQYAYSATLDTASATLTNYERLALSTLSTITLADPNLQTQISPDQLLATSIGEINFDAYAVDASTYAVRTVIEANSYYQIRIYATSEPINVQQAAQLNPYQVWYANNPYDYQVVFEQSESADLTQFYISVQLERISDAQEANWVPVTEAAFATDTFAIAPTDATLTTSPDATTQTVVVNTVTEADACLQDRTKVCVNQYGTTLTTSADLTTQAPAPEPVPTPEPTPPPMPVTCEVVTWTSGATAVSGTSGCSIIDSSTSPSQGHEYTDSTGVTNKWDYALTDYKCGTNGQLYKQERICTPGCTRSPSPPTGFSADAAVPGTSNCHPTGNPSVAECFTYSPGGTVCDNNLADYSCGPYGSGGAMVLMKMAVSCSPS